MADAVLASISFLSEDFLAQKNVDLADETVFEVFASMLGLEVAVTPATHTADRRRRRAHCDCRLLRSNARML